MTLKVPRLPITEGAADRVLRELEIDALPVDPVRIAAIKNIAVQAAPPSTKGFSGMLAQWDTNFGIMYTTYIDNPGFQRFSIAHELGHYFLPGHVEQVLANGPHKSHAGFGSRDPYEQEADFFAAALLMPAQLVKPIINRREDGITCVKSLSSECETSLTASAVRYTRLSKSAVAIVLSQNGLIDFCLFSDALKEAKVRWPRAGTPLPRETLTARFAAEPRNISSAREGSEQVDLIDWFDCPTSHVVSEEVVGLGSYGKVLTVLYSRRITSVSEGLDDDEEDEEALIESWTPRFRK